jgi:hypothetical protein
MISVRCCNPEKNPDNDPTKTGCTAPNGVFKFTNPRYRRAEPANEYEVGACSILAICSYCGFENLIWLKGGPVDEVYDTVGAHEPPGFL